MKKRKKIKCNESNCMGCGICAVACSFAHTKDLNQLLVDKNHKLQSRNTVACRTSLSFMNTCKNCEAAPCIKACVSGSITRNDKGSTLINQEKCIGCWSCIMVCPNGAIRMAEMEDGRKISIKCDLCEDRETPACVEACPNNALTAEEYN